MGLGTGWTSGGGAGSLVGQDVTLTKVLAGDGTAALPSVSFTSDTDTGIYRTGANSIGIAAAGARSLRLTSSSVVYGDTDTSILNLNSSVGAQLAYGAQSVTADSVFVTIAGPAKVSTSLTFVALAVSNTLPTISAGFGTSPTLTAANGTAAFLVTIGAGGTASTGTITFPAALTGWVVQLTDVTTNASFVTSQTGGSTTTATVQNYSRTTGLGIAWTAGDVLRCTAVAY